MRAVQRYSGNSHDRRKARRKEMRLSSEPPADYLEGLKHNLASEIATTYTPPKTLWQRIKAYLWDKFFWTDYK